MWQKERPAGSGLAMSISRPFLEILAVLIIAAANAVSEDNESNLMFET
jgi:hypothetical protein